jgi:hypothetical protein
MVEDEKRGERVQQMEVTRKQRRDVSRTASQSQATRKKRTVMERKKNLIRQTMR